LGLLNQGPQPYFAMEFIQGSSLRDYVETRRMNARQRLEIISKVAEAVHHAHQRGLIHRDLKPGNILVDETGQPKILDFGVARVTDSDAQATLRTNVGELVGTQGSTEIRDRAMPRCSRAMQRGWPPQGQLPAAFRYGICAIRRPRR
jgi:serine/threonine protein kinase